MGEPHRVLLLGGTTEGAALAKALADDPRFAVTTSLAGRTRRPAALPGTVRVGGFGGAAGLASYLAEQRIDSLVDATHPFAATISRHAAEACHATGTARLRLVRPPWRAAPGDQWVEVASAAEAATCLPGAGRRAFLTVGRRALASFADRPHTWYLVRVVDPPDTPLIDAPHLVIAARGPFALEDEIALLRRHRIEVLVTRNSGGTATRAKLDAARRLGLPVVMIARPEEPSGERVASVEETMEWLGARLRGS